MEAREWKVELKIVENLSLKICIDETKLEDICIVNYTYFWYLC